MATYRVVLIDDEKPNLESLERVLKSDGAEVSCYQDPAEALVALRERGADVVITDLRMGKMTGLELLSALKLLDPAIEVVLITAYGTVALAVEAMKKGAYDFVTKPLQRMDVLRCVHKALEKRRLVSENSSLREQLTALSTPAGSEILGRSDAVRDMLQVAEQAGHSRANVFIDGESGTGKGALAEFIHRSGASNGGLFVKINCASIPENLLEAELFGYEPGAFTGANKRKKGRVELAEGGTLFLDEIGIAPPTFQAKLLRFLQDGEFERLGGNETHRVVTRVISATNANLKEAIRQGSFREDLFYRLNVVHIPVPPLRDRPDDIPLLASRFVQDAAKKNARSELLLEPAAVQALCAYHWPGNIRELQNVIERLVVLGRGATIRREDLPADIGGSTRARSLVLPLGLPLREIEERVMEETLRTTNGDKKLAAKMLGIHPRTIYRFLETRSEETANN